LSPHCASKDGIHEFIQRHEDYQYFELRIYDENGLLGLIEITPESLNALRDYAKNQKGANKLPFAKYSEVVEMTSFVDAIKNNPEVKSFLMKLGETINDNAAASLLYQLINSPDAMLQLHYTSRVTDEDSEAQAIVEAKMRSLIVDYRINVEKSNEPLEKLALIVIFIRDCAQLHPFHDANGRVLCMLLLNFLLIKEGFPLALLHDSNAFNFCTVNELLVEVIKGFENTFDLIENANAFKKQTDQITELLKSKQIYKPLLDYFENVIAIEEKMRRPELDARVEKK
jgi:hypothetical protein